jgi:hypothetical protein
MTTPEPTPGDGTATCVNPDCPERGVAKTVPPGTIPPVFCGGFGPGFHCGAELEIAPNVIGAQS